MMSLAGLKPCGVLCELTNHDGTMARMPEIVSFALKHSMPVVTLKIWLTFLKGNIKWLEMNF